MLWQWYAKNVWSDMSKVLLPPLSTPENAPLQEPKGGGGGLDWNRTHLTTKYRRYWAKRRKFHELNQYIKINPSLFLALSFNSKKLNSDTSRLRCLLQTFSCFVLWLQVDSQWAKLTKKSVKIHVERQQFLWECCPLFLWSSPQSPAFVRLSPLPSSLLDTLWSLFGYICLYTILKWYSNLS